MKPTGAELEILNVLWTDGPSTVREVWRELGQKTGYTGILKQMQVMHEKGFLKRDERKRSHIYSACHIKNQTVQGLISDLRRMAFGGSASKLVLSALSDETISSDELREIRELIDQLETERSQP